jgi:hypothetical protein
MVREHGRPVLGCKMNEWNARESLGPAYVSLDAVAGSVDRVHITRLMRQATFKSRGLQPRAPSVDRPPKPHAPQCDI